MHLKCLKMFVFVLSELEFDHICRYNLYDELNNKINYPVIAREMGIEGTVIVEFIVTRAGKIRDIKILKGIGGGCDNEVVRVLKNMPKLQPAIKDGNPVSSKMILPIRFTLK